MERKLSLLRLAVILGVAGGAAYHLLGRYTNLRFSLPVDDSPYPLVIGVLIVIAAIVAMFCQRDAE